MVHCALTHASSVVVTPLASATRPRLTAHSANTIAAVARNVPARSAHAAASSSARTLRPLHLPPAAILCVFMLPPATHLLRSARHRSRRLAATGAVAPRLIHNTPKMGDASANVLAKGMNVWIPNPADKDPKAAPFLAAQLKPLQLTALAAPQLPRAPKVVACAPADGSLVQAPIKPEADDALIAPESAGEVLVFTMVNDSGTEEHVIALLDAHRCFNFRKSDIEIVFDNANGEAEVE